MLALIGGGWLLVRGVGAPSTADAPTAPSATADAPGARPHLALAAPLRGADRATGTRRLLVHVDEGRPPPVPGTLVWFQGHPETEAVSDAEGNLEIVVPDGATLLVGKRADGHWARTKVPSDVRHVELAFASEVSLAGTVRAPDGAPRVGFRVRVNGIGAQDPTRRDPAMRDYDRRAEVVEATTDVAGAFEVRGLESRIVTIESADPEFRMFGWDGHVTAQVPSSALEWVADRVRIVSVQCVESKTDFPLFCQTVAVTNWPVGYSANLLPFPPQPITKIPWPAGPTEVDPPIVQFLSSGYLPRTARLDASVPMEDGILTIHLDPDPSAPPSGTIRLLAPEGLDFGRAGFVDLIEPNAEEHVRHARPVTVRGQRYLLGVPVGEFKVRVLGRSLDSTVLVRAGETTDLTWIGPRLRPIVVRPRLGEHAIGGWVMCILTPDASKTQTDRTGWNSRVTGTRIEVGPDGTASLGVIEPGAYSVLIGRDTDSGKATFTVPDAGASSEPIVVDVPMVARSATDAPPK